MLAILFAGRHWCYDSKRFAGFCFRGVESIKPFEFNVDLHPCLSELLLVTLPLTGIPSYAVWDPK